MRKLFVSLSMLAMPAMAFAEVTFDHGEVLTRYTREMAFLEANPHLKLYPDNVLRSSGCTHPNRHMGMVVCCPFGEWCEGKYGKRNPEFANGPRFVFGKFRSAQALSENVGLNFGTAKPWADAQELSIGMSE